MPERIHDVRQRRRDQLQRFIKDNMEWIENQRRDPVTTIDDWLNAEVRDRRQAVREAENELKRL